MNLKYPILFALVITIFSSIAASQDDPTPGDQVNLDKLEFVPDLREEVGSLLFRLSQANRSQLRQPADIIQTTEGTTENFSEMRIEIIDSPTEDELRNEISQPLAFSPDDLLPSRFFYRKLSRSKRRKFRKRSRQHRNAGHHSARQHRRRSVRATMDEKTPPKASVSVLRTVATPGEDVRITCPVEGYPSPIIEWTKDGEKIDYTWTKITTARKSLRIRDVDESDTGVFTCRGINGFGSVSVRVELIVTDSPRKLSPDSPNASSSQRGAMDDKGHGKTISMDDDIPDHHPRVGAAPVFTKKTKALPNFYKKQQRESFQLDCEALGVPPPAVTWLHDMTPISASGPATSPHTLQLHSVKESDSGLYTCLASNPFGQTSRQFSLTVESPRVDLPVIAPIPNVTLGDDNGAVGPVSLTCTVQSLLTPDIQWLRDAVSSVDGNDDMAVDDDGKVSYTVSLGDLLLQPAKGKVVKEEKRVTTKSNSGNLVMGHAKASKMDTTTTYTSTLVLSDLTEDDLGLYVCLATNSAGGFNYRITHVLGPKRGLRGSQVMSDQSLPSSSDFSMRNGDKGKHLSGQASKADSDSSSLLDPLIVSANGGLPPLVLYLVIGLSGLVLFLLSILFACLVRSQRQKLMLYPSVVGGSNAGNGVAGERLHDSGLMHNHSKHAMATSVSDMGGGIQTSHTTLIYQTHTQASQSPQLGCMTGAQVGHQLPANDTWRTVNSSCSDHQHYTPTPRRMRMDAPIMLNKEDDTQPLASFDLVTGSNNVYDVPYANQIRPKPGSSLLKTPLMTALKSGNRIVTSASANPANNNKYTRVPTQEIANSPLLSVRYAVANNNKNKIIAGRSQNQKLTDMCPGEMEDDDDYFMSVSEPRSPVISMSSAGDNHPRLMSRLTGTSSSTHSNASTNAGSSDTSFAKLPASFKSPASVGRHADRQSERCRPAVGIRSCPAKTERDAMATLDPKKESGNGFGIRSALKVNQRTVEYTTQYPDL